MRIEARAKINWTLDILGQRPDGYHLLDMLMQPITLCDDITLEKADEITLTTSGTPHIEPNEHNLAYRAAAALKQAAGYAGGAAIHVHKRIPSGAGLGGGSADAAGVLKGLNRLWHTGLDQAQLEAVGLTLGADVPFCLRGGLAQVGGVGEIMTPLPGAHAWPLVIIQPCEGLATGAVFRAYHAAAHVLRPDTQAARDALLRGDLQALRPALGNALESVSRALRPEIGDAVSALSDCGAICAGMSGSGSAVFGVFLSEQTARSAAQRLAVQWPRTFVCSTCEESIVMEESQAERQ